MSDLNKQVYWLALYSIRDIVGLDALPIIFESFPDIEDFWGSKEFELKKIGWNANQIKFFFDIKRRIALDYFLDMSDYLIEKEIKIVTLFDSDYPSNLKKSATSRIQPPLLLFVKGKLEINGKAVAIVGTRNASDYAKEKTKEFAVKLANDGYTIVSGLARGIDREAHLGALSTQEGKTIATLAWLEPVYPPEHTELSKEIEKRGAVISEILKKPLNTTYDYGRSRFVIRNRIISGLSNFVIAVESGADGGTIRQVELARSQNKPVYTLEPTDKSDYDKMKGFIRMFRMGAKPIRSLDDLSNLKIYQQS